MGTKLRSPENSAYEALDRLLFREWDPIGVSLMGGPDDEYRSYLPQLWQLVSSGAAHADIAGYLAAIERDVIQMETSEMHRLDIAAKALALWAAWKLPVRN